MSRKRLSPIDADAARARVDYAQVRARFQGNLSEARKVLRRAELSRIVRVGDELARIDRLPFDPPCKVKIPYVRRDGIDGVNRNPKPTARKV